MAKNDYEVLKRGYREYAMTDEAAAVYFVRDVVNAINTRGKWIDVTFTDRYAVGFDKKPAFKKVIVELFNRKILPQYPEGADRDLKRAITWEVSHRDIKNQKCKGISGPQFEVTGLYCNKDNRKFKNIKFEQWYKVYNNFDFMDRNEADRIVTSNGWRFIITRVKRIKE